MPIYTGPELCPESHDDGRPVARHMPRYFPQDVATYTAAQTRVLANTLEAGPPPVDTVLHDTIDANPFSAPYLEYVALKDKGFSVHFRAQESLEHPVPESKIGVHVDKAHGVAVAAVMAATKEGESLLYQPILHRMIGRVTARWLDPKVGPGNQTFKEMVGRGHHYSQLDGLLTRTFLTSRIVSEIQPKILPKPSTRDLQIYELLRRKGERPFTIKELQSMATKLTTLAMDKVKIAAPY